MVQFFKLSSTIFFILSSSTRKFLMKKFFVLLLMCGLSLNVIGQELLSQQRAERLLNEGVSLMMRKQYGPARQTFENLIQHAPAGTATRAEAKYYAAFCALNLYHNNAEKLIDDFVSENPKHPKASSAYFDLANFYYAEKNYKKANINYKKVQWSALSITEHNTGRFRAAYSLFNLRFLGEALDQFNFVKSLGGQYGPAASYYAGFIEYSQADYKNALIDLQRAGQNEAYAKIVPYLIANVYYRQKSYDQLLKYIESLGKDVSNREDIDLLAAEAYFKKGDHKKALPAYEVYLEDREDNTDKAVLLRAGYSAFVGGNDDKALRYLKKSFADNDSVGFYSSYYLGALYLKKQQKPMALASFDISRRFKADQRLVEESTFLYSKISYEMGKPDQAITELEKMLVQFPNSTHTTEIKELLSQAYVNANNYNKAIAYIESLPKRGPSVDRAYQKATLLKGQELFNKDDYEGAAALFEKSLASPVEPDYVAEASLWAGESYSIVRKYDQAATHYLRLVGMQSAHPSFISKGRYGLGYIYYNQKEYDRALFNFKEFVNKATKTESNLADGMIRLADCYFISKQYADALGYYSKASAMRNGDEDYTHLQRGVILGIQSKYAEAQSELDYLIQRFPNSSYLEEARFNKAQLDFEQGKYAAAVTNYSTVISASSSSKFTPYALSKRAASYYNLKEFGKTADDYISILEKYSTHPISNDVLLPLQESLNLAGRSAEFEKYLSGFKVANPDAKGIESVEFEAAKSLYFNQDYPKAITGLTSFISNYPESPKVTEARYYQAEALYRTKEFIKALQVYKTIFPEKTFAFANKVVARLAEIEFKNGSYDKAIPYFHLLETSAANKKEQYNAWSGLMEAHYLLAQYDSAIVYANIILEKGSINAGAQNKASLYLGKCSMGKGDYETAKDEFLSTLNSARDEYGAEAKYLLGEIFYLTKDHKQCYETLVSLTTDFAAYPEWVGKAFLLLSDSYLAQGDRYQAKATLKSLGEFPLQPIRDTAKDRLNKLELEDKPKAPAKADSEDNEKQNR